MVTRLSASDASFFGLENSSTPMYVSSLSILRKPRKGLSYETLLETVEQRLPQIPRYRQKVREVTLGLARPVWVDDREFDITYHIRRSALPYPGSDAQLHELVFEDGAWFFTMELVDGIDFLSYVREPTDTAEEVTLEEGGTPLVRSEALSAETGCEVFLKFEGANPTGSFKDRGMTVAISKAVEEGAKAVVCASTGNTSASAAAYAGKAGLT